MKRNSKGFAHLLLAVIIVIGIGGILYYSWQKELIKTTPSNVIPLTPTLSVDETENWETYSHSVVPFTFKYPNDIEIRESITNEENKEDSVTLIKRGPTQKEGTELYDGLGLRFGFNYLTGRGLEEFVDERIAESEEIGKVLEKKQETKFQNYKAYTYKGEGLGIADYIYLQTPDGRIYIEIVNFTSDPSEQGFGLLVDQILSTFKFIE